MSSLSEQDPPNPNDLTYDAPGWLRERSKSQPSLSQEARSEPSRSPISAPASPGMRLKNAVAGASWNRLDPEVIDQPLGLARRAALFRVAGRFAAAAGVLMIVALFFVITLPASRQSDAGLTSSKITGSIRPALPQSGKGDNGSKPALAEFEALLASAPASKPATHEQSPQLLQQFLQWRQKADSTGTSQ